jgi:tRNA threonylcarbamoyladenosine biosynthesis protein TsaE
MIFLSTSEAETDALAAQIAATLRPGDVLALDGPLGAGKTRFVRGLVAALGASPRLVSSPTFVLLHIYPTPTLTVYHLDAYRLRSEADLEAIGFTELATSDGLTLIEWADRAPGLLPAHARHVRIEPLGETQRQFTITPHAVP